MPIPLPPSPAPVTPMPPSPNETFYRRNETGLGEEMIKKQQIEEEEDLYRERSIDEILDEVLCAE
jgi:hypothetical protein